MASSGCQLLDHLGASRHMGTQWRQISPQVFCLASVITTRQRHLVEPSRGAIPQPSYSRCCRSRVTAVPSRNFPSRRFSPLGMARTPESAHPRTTCDARTENANSVSVARPTTRGKSRSKQLSPRFDPNRRHVPPASLMTTRASTVVPMGFFHLAIHCPLYGLASCAPLISGISAKPTATASARYMVQAPSVLSAIFSLPTSPAVWCEHSDGAE